MSDDFDLAEFVKRLPLPSHDYLASKIQKAMQSHRQGGMSNEMLLTVVLSRITREMRRTYGDQAKARLQRFVTTMDESATSVDIEVVVPAADYRADDMMRLLSETLRIVIQTAQTTLPSDEVFGVALTQIARQMHTIVGPQTRQVLQGFVDTMDEAAKGDR